MARPDESRNYVRTTIVFEAVLGLVASLLGWARGAPPWALLDWNSRAVAWGLLATLPPLALLAVSMRIPTGPLRRLNDLVGKLLTELFADSSLFDLALISLAAGVGEELLFRGFLQPLAADYLGPTAALVIVSVLFGLAHALTKTYAILATVVGFYLGWLWLAFDNLLVPIVAHAAYDFVALVYLLRVERRR